MLLAFLKRSAGDFNETRVNELLPVGYYAEAEMENRFAIRSENGNHKVGSVEVRDVEVVFRFYNDDEVSSEFVTAFGLKNPSQNPTTRLCGFVYNYEETASFQLDKRPFTLREEAMREVKHYAEADNVFFVSFLRGEMEPDWLMVQTMQKVLPGGKLGEDMGPHMLRLGKIENEKTM